MDKYGDICGWSEMELIEHFASGIQALADKRKENFDITLKELRNYYDGYLFTDEGSRQYNPYSMLKALIFYEMGPKYNKSVEEAMAQIHSRDYAGRYALDPRTVFLIGVNFTEDKDDRILQYEIQILNK